MVTAYDSITTRLAEDGGIQLILVGDSVGNVMLGYDSTVPVTMEEMVHHTRAVTRTSKSALIIGDMPFGSYLEPGPALANAARLLKEGGCDAVKLEGGMRVAHIIRALVDAGVAVMGHVGLTPQTHAQLGGYRVQGRTTQDALRLIEDALAVQEAGAFAVVLECVPAQLAAEVTQRLAIPTIGIGAGADCSGQVLVCADMLGTHPLPPRFVKVYADLGPQIAAAFAAFRQEVEDGVFPLPCHATQMAEPELAELRTSLAAGVLEENWSNSVKSPTPPSVSANSSDQVDALRHEIETLRCELRAKQLNPSEPASMPSADVAMFGRATSLVSVAAASFGLSLVFGSQSKLRAEHSQDNI